MTKGSTITVRVPKGAEHGHLLRLKGMGHEHPEGDSGDLLITVRLDAEEGLRWEDGRLIQEVRLPYTMLALGGKVRITTLGLKVWKQNYLQWMRSLGMSLHLKPQPKPLKLGIEMGGVIHMKCHGYGIIMKGRVLRHESF